MVRSQNFSYLSIIHSYIVTSPGRFHASLIIKMILSQLLLKYEFKLEDEKARTRWSWETFTMPYESTRVVFTKC